MRNVRKRDTDAKTSLDVQKTPFRTTIFTSFSAFSKLVRNIGGLISIL
jgi:hypothetical protein